MKVSVYIATSLDGFIARPDGSLDWLPGSDPDAGGSDEAVTNSNEGGDDHGWGEFWGSVDCLVQGRKTFENVLELTSGAWPYKGTRAIVLSRNPALSVPDELQGEVEIYAGDPRTLVEKLAAEGHERLYVDGGQTIQAFQRLGLITDMSITTIPVLIGQGIPLFGPLPEDILLRHIKTGVLPGGMVQTTYEI